MPYPLGLQKYVPPEFERQPPPEWERRLREVSPHMPNLDRLIFRWFEPKNPNGSDRGWLHKEHGQWTLYAAKDKRLATPEKAKLFEKHWSELFTEGEQVARKSEVSDYQHFMWHSRGLMVRPFMILQGEWGGTPCAYTPKEKAFLDASDCLSEPAPIGLLKACPFDERTVQTIAARDRLLEFSNNEQLLAEAYTPEARKAEDAAAEFVRRQTFLDTWKIIQQPIIEFMQYYMKRSEHREEFPDAPDDLNNRVGSYKEQYLEHGSWVGSTNSTTTKLSVPITVH